MSRLGSVIVYGLKQLQQPKREKKRAPMTARSIFGDVLYDTYLYYTTPRMTEAEREEFQKFMAAPVAEPPKKLTTEQRLARLERQAMGKAMPYTTKPGRRIK